MIEDHFVIAGNLAAAWFAGSVIGLERSYHGRPAGFRTHALVCLASALLMLVTTYQWNWLGPVPLETVRTDPTRIAQGIMTGIGFLGAGVIFKEGLTVRGLTTAASIWITAAIGILFGAGFFFPAVLATVASIGTLALFRRIEAKLPSQCYAALLLRFRSSQIPPESEVRSFVETLGFSIAALSYRLDLTSAFFEYRMTVSTNNGKAIGGLAAALARREDLIEFKLSPAGD